MLKRNFMLIFASTFMFFSSFYLLLPTLPLYALGLGATKFEIGLIMGVFTISAVVARPYFGKMIDRYGGKVFMVFGSIVFFFSSIFYIPSKSVFLLLLLRVFHGLGIASFTTASLTLISSISEEKRGEFLSLFGISTILAISGAPAFGIYVMNFSGFETMFFLSSIFALASLFLSLPILSKKAKRDVSGSLKAMIKKRSVLVPTLTIFTCTTTYGALIAFLPLFTKEENIDMTFFFTFYAISTITFRLFIGRVSDRVGREVVIKPFLLVLSLSVFLISFLTQAMLFIVAFLYGASFGTVYSLLTALVADRVSRGRGVAMSIFTSAFDLGIAFGSVGFGAIVEIFGFRVMYGILSLALLAGFFLFSKLWR